MKIERSPRAAVLLAALVGALVSLATPAHADGDPRTDAVPRMFPYQGQLELDGRPVHATGDDALHLRFALYAAPDMEQPVYQQDIVVEVYSGHFTATIGPIGAGPDGSERAIAEVIAAADDLSLGITLLGDPADPADDIALGNRQRIHATPYAMWSTTATDLGVARRLDVAGDARIAGALRVDGPLTITPGALADGTVRAADLDPAMLGDGIIQSGATVRVDPDWLADEIRTWVRSHCRVQLGWRNRCNNWTSNRPSTSPFRPTAPASARSARTRAAAPTTPGAASTRTARSVPTMSSTSELSVTEPSPSPSPSPITPQPS